MVKLSKAMIIIGCNVHKDSYNPTIPESGNEKVFYPNKSPSTLLLLPSSFQTFEDSLEDPLILTPVGR